MKYKYKKFHNPLLHDGDVEETKFPENRGENDNENRVNLCLLQLMQVKAKTSIESPVTVFWDNGATLSLITFDAARRLKLKGKQRKITVTAVGAGKETIDSSVYELPLIDQNGERVLFKVYGIEKISTRVKRVDVDKVVHLFSNLKPSTKERPEGSIDVLIGFEYAGFHPVTIQSAGHLVLVRNRFGECLGGSHPELIEETQKVIQNVIVHHVAAATVEDFYKTENLGVECSPRCGSCRCGKCPFGGKDYC